MTGPCSGVGVGTPKPDFAAIQIIGPAAISGALWALAGWRGAAVGASIGTLQYELSTFCPDGPPAMPEFDAADIVNLLSPIPLPGTPASRLKFADFISNLIWPTLCDCSSGTSTLDPPADYPADGPGADAPVGAPTTSCGGFTRTTSDFSSGTSSYWLGVTPIPIGATSFRIVSDGAIVSDGGVSYYYQMQENGSGSMVNTTVSDTFAPGVPHTFTGPIFNPNSTYLAAHIHYVSGGGTSLAHDTLEVYCGGAAPGGVQEPCCPPDAATQAQLDRILAMVTLLQRQAAPFSYVYGDNHTGLSGHGSFAVSGLLGVAVDVTTLPDSYGRSTGSPEALFGLGYVNLGTADGWTQSRAIDHDGSLFIPVAGGLYTAVGYSLSPGVGVAIRELVREP